MGIILASSSPRRKELLEKAGVRFGICQAAVNEDVSLTDPEQLVKELACQKACAAAAVIAKEPGLGNAKPDEGLLVIGADTVVVWEGKILGKPKDEEDAIETLKLLQGKTHQVCTGVSVKAFGALPKTGKGLGEAQWNEKDSLQFEFCETTLVTFYPVSEEDILSYVRSGEPMDKAGSYGIQGSWGVFVKGIQGDYQNVVGLPVARLFYECRLRGLDLRKGIS